MKIKLTVASRVENLTPQGKVSAVVLMHIPEQNGAGVPVKLEIGNMPEELAKNFPIGRTLEIEIPTYQRGIGNAESSRIITPN